MPTSATFVNRLVLVSFACSVLLGAGLLAEEPLAFTTDIQPILKAKCLACHSAEKRKGGLNLATLEALALGGESGSPLVAGKPNESLLLEMVRDGEMPPEGEGLSAEQIELFQRWIEEGSEIRKTQREQQITQHQIIPLMALRCTVCHGGRKREADLDLRTKASILAGGKSGPAVVSGEPQDSLLVKRIHAEEMPPRRLLVTVSVKPMPANELAMLEAWIAAGLPEAPLKPDVATTEPDPLVDDEERKFWSFQSPRTVAPKVIPIADRELAENEVDHYIMAKRAAGKIATPPNADRHVLIRRLYFDLIGLPPTPDEVFEFIADESPRAYERLVDRLLASPRYGERWGRHWLDVAGYADSEGSQNEDRVRPRMWRYRDYVIRAFNADKPYDRFLHEQVAGDELADYENAKVITDEIYDNLVATGFLRTAPDRTFAGITNFVPDRLELIADEIQVLGSAVMGLTLHCARCHTHKFDPIPQRDYYRLAATLKDALDENDWLAPQPRSLNFVTTAERKAWQQNETTITEQVAALQKQVEAEQNAEAKKKLEEQIKQAEAGRKPEPRIRALWSRGQPSPTYVLKRGNYLTPGREVGPGVPSMLTNGKTPFDVQPPWPGAKASGRRLALARWLTEPDHPLTARVMVNRIWMHHFGQPLVATPGNFGLTGAKPTHPELLDWLAVEFVRQDWSVKALHRLILTSHTYRITSQVTPHLLEADPNNDFYSRMPLRRLEAESLRDSLLYVAGELNEIPFGSPDDVNARADGLVTSEPRHGGWRRSIYVLHRRTKLPTLLESFDSPQMSPNCLERDESIVAPQALHLLNDAMVYELAGRFAARIEDGAGSDVELQIGLVYSVAFGREPDADEVAASREMIAGLRQRWLAALQDKPDADREASRRALTNFCHAVMNSAAFIYVD